MTWYLTVHNEKSKGKLSAALINPFAVGLKEIWRQISLHVGLYRPALVQTEAGTYGMKLA